MRRVVAMLALAAAVAAPATAGAAEPAGPSAAAVTLKLTDAGAVATVLRPAAAVTRFDVAVPHRWIEAGLEIDLRWNGSAMLAAGSALAVEVGDVPVAAVALEAGAGALRVVSPSLPVTTHRLAVTIRATLNAAAGVTPRAAARGLFVRLDPSSRVRLTGVSGPEPVLADLPGALVVRTGDLVTPLTILLPASPPAEAIHAAAVVAGAVAAQTGFPGQAVVALVDPAPADLDAIPGSVVRIEHEPGAARVAVRARPGGATELTVRGGGDELVSAATAVAYRSASLPGDEAVVSGPRMPAPKRRPLRDTLRLGPAAAEDTEPVVVRLPFRIPESRVVDAALADIEIGVDAPAGGRLSVRANGHAIESRALGRSGDGRLSINTDLTKAVRPGDNSIEIIVTPAGEGGRPVRIDVMAGSRLRLRTHARVEPSLDWWPFLSAGDEDWSGTVVSIPARPTPDEAAAVISTLAEAVRWSGGPLRYRIAYDASIQESLRTGNLVALVRTPEAAAGVVPGGATDGSLALVRRGAHAALIAVGPRALTPLSSGYFVGSISGSAVVVDWRGRVHPVVGAPREPEPGRRWWWPAGIATAVVVLLLGIGFLRAKRRFAPAENDVPWKPSVPDSVVPRPRPRPAAEPRRVDADRALDEWLRIREEHSL